jgi:glutaminyl-peptide cyclotransferase
MVASIMCCATCSTEPMSGDIIPAPLVEELSIDVIARHPHDPEAFTQGLAWRKGQLLESTGLTGLSSLREVDLETGEIERVRDLPHDVFAEGIAFVGDEVYQLTWQAQEGYVWTAEHLTLNRTFSYVGEGWGLCFDGQLLVMSDGTDALYFREPQTFRVVRKVDVTFLGEPLYRLNELECVDGRVYANVWRSTSIVRIDPLTGRVEARIRANGLLDPTEEEQADVLNGIAYIPEAGHFLVTGKYWPWLFRVNFVPQ